MKRMMLAALAFALSGLAGCATVADAPPDYEALLTAPCANAADTAPWLLVDTWEDGDTYKPETQFRPDGVMIYAYNGTTYDNGRWRLEGNMLHFDTNNHYADYMGTFDGQAASGVMKNQPGGKGTWTLTRDCAG